MKRIPGTAVATATLILASAGALRAQNTESQLIVPVVVTDSIGRFVTGLEPEHFTITVDGIESTVSELVSVDEPLQLAVVMLDTDARSLTALMEISRTLGSRLSSSPAVIEGQGSVLDKLQEAFTLLSERPGQRKAVLMVGDRDVTSSQEEIRDSVIGEGIPVFALSSGQDTGSLDVDGAVSGSAFLDEVARQTGGLHSSMDDALRAGIGLANYYMLILSVPNEGGDSASLGVEMASSRGLRSLEVTHRISYSRLAN